MTLSLMFLFTLTLYLPYLSAPLGLSLALIAASGATALVWATRGAIWLALALVLVFVGGMMVMFIYISSLASQPLLPKMPVILLSLAPLMMVVPLSPFLGSPPVSVATTYTPSVAPVFMALAAYLLLALLVVVKFTQSFKGSVLKQF